MLKTTKKAVVFGTTALGKNWKPWVKLSRPPMARVNVRSGSAYFALTAGRPPKKEAHEKIKAGNVEEPIYHYFLYGFYFEVRIRYRIWKKLSSKKQAGRKQEIYGS